MGRVPLRNLTRSIEVDAVAFASSHGPQKQIMGLKARRFERIPDAAAGRIVVESRPYEVGREEHANENRQRRGRTGKGGRAAASRGNRDQKQISQRQSEGQKRIRVSGSTVRVRSWCGEMAGREKIERGGNKSERRNGPAHPKRVFARCAVRCDPARHEEPQRRDGRKDVARELGFGKREKNNTENRPSHEKRGQRRVSAGTKPARKAPERDGQPRQQGDQQNRKVKPNGLDMLEFRGEEALEVVLDDEDAEKIGVAAGANDVPGQGGEAEGDDGRGMKQAQRVAPAFGPKRPQEDGAARE